MPPRAPTADGPLRRVARGSILLAVFAVLSQAPAPARADVVRILCDDREAAQARADLIQTAESEINVASFAVADDQIGRAFLALLRDAARRGVTVRLLVDGLNNHIPDNIQRQLIACGVQ